MTGYEAYGIYVALKLHFKQPNYDYFKFCGKIRGNQETFQRRRDRFYFVKSAKVFSREEYQAVLVSNLIVNDQFWIGEIFSGETKQRYENWRRVNQSLNYIFCEDMQKIKDLIDRGEVENFNALFAPGEVWPKIVGLGMQNTIRLETFIIMDQVIPFILKLDKKIKDTILWPEFKKRCIKYRPFIQADILRCKKIMQEIFLD